MTSLGAMALLIVKCLEPAQCSVVLEPYGSEIILSADDELHLEIRSAEAEPLEVAYSPGCITVWIPSTVTSVRARNRLREPVDLGLPF